MSGSVDVGDSFELTFMAEPGSVVSLSLFDPYEVTVLDHVAVLETPVGSGRFPRLFTVSAPGMWTALLTATTPAGATDVERFYVRGVPVTDLPPLATTGEVEAQFGTLTPAQQALTKTLLRAASKIVRQRYPQVDALIAAGKLDAEVVGLAVTNMVLRVLRNPRGLRAETTGPFSVTYDTTVAAGELVLSDTEIGMLTPRKVGAAGRVGTIRVRPGLPLSGGYGRGW